MQINPILPATVDQWLSLGMYGIVAAFGAGIGTYITQKVKNLATKADVAELTKIVKTIEAEISDEAWARQRSWNLKREIIFELVKEVAALRNNLIRLDAAYANMRQQQNVAAKKSQMDESAAFDESFANFGKWKLLTAVVGSGPLVDQVEAVYKVAVEIWGIIINDQGEAESWRLTNEIDKLTPFIRQELGMD